MFISLVLKNKRYAAGQRIAALALMAVLVLLLSACSASPASAPVNVQGAAGGDAATPTSAAAVSFSQDVLPILQSRCLRCHGGERTEKGLNMTSYEKLMAGSQKGAVVIPGDPDKSSFIQLVVQGKMPKSGPKLLPAQTQMLIDWVTAGALNN
jgi:uncharacterized membrane protein